MKLIFVGIVILILLVGGILLYKDYYVNRRLRRLAVEKYKRFEPLMKKLEAGEWITKDEVLSMARDPSLRHAIFGMLQEYGKGDLFPGEYFTHEKGAEGFLVNWLEFPTELGVAPNEIALFTKITLEENEPLDYYVFKFRTLAPHWASEYDWMMGVSGPYGKESKPYDVPTRVFSRFNPLEMIPAEVEVKWVHTNIGQ